MVHTAEIDVAVWCTPPRLTPRWAGLGICSLVSWANHSFFAQKMSDSLKKTSSSLIRSFLVRYPHLSWATWANHSLLLISHEGPERFAHSRSFVLMGCTLQSFLKIPISWRNQKRIWKYSSLFISGPGGFKSWKNRGKKSRDTLPPSWSNQQHIDEKFPVEIHQSRKASWVPRIWRATYWQEIDSSTGIHKHANLKYHRSGIHKHLVWIMKT